VFVARQLIDSELRHVRPGDLVGGVVSLKDLYVPGGGEADAGSATGDHGGLSRQFLSMLITYMVSPFCFSLFLSL
jgi:hypothetical protein